MCGVIFFLARWLQLALHLEFFKKSVKRYKVVRLAKSV